MTDTYLAIDIGGSFIKYGYGTVDGGLTFFDSVPNTAGDRQALYSLLQQTVEGVLDKLPSIKAICLGSPGIIDVLTGNIVANCPNIPGWVGANPKTLLEKIFSIPVFIENDADLMTYGEAQIPSRKGKSVLGITIGTGIGSGFVTNNNIFHSNNYSFLELGHTVVVPDGRLCLCGKKGCVEAYSSVSSIIGNINKETGNSLSLTEILKESKENRVIGQILHDAYDKLALAIANAVMLLGAEDIVIGGGMTENQYFDITPLTGKINSYLTPFYQDRITIEPAAYKNKAALWGGIALCPVMLS